ncbi:MAG TPA: hypothetical protein VFQ36_11645 [Ktedonobacteraceae bacterium]|nr:hypothetical protein [Ktedonobacteraceae bacterium]
MNTENTERQEQHSEGQHESKGIMRGQVLRCANCDIEILWTPTIARGAAYCCTGCAAGGPCNCDYSQYRSVNIAGVIHYYPDAS